MAPLRKPYGTCAHPRVHDEHYGRKRIWKNIMKENTFGVTLPEIYLSGAAKFDSHKTRRFAEHRSLIVDFGASSATFTGATVLGLHPHNTQRDFRKIGLSRRDHYKTSAVQLPRKPKTTGLPSTQLRSDYAQHPAFWVRGAANN